MFEKLAIISVSRRCNHACVWCSEGDVHDGELTSLDEVDEVLGRLVEQGYRGVNFMGAETTVRSDVPELMQLVRSHGLRIGLTTNGVRFANEKFAQSVLPWLDTLEFSLPTTDPDAYRAITSRKHLPTALLRARREGRATEEDVLDLDAVGEAFQPALRIARDAGQVIGFRGLPPCILPDELAHNLYALDRALNPDITYLNKQPLQRGVSIEDKANLDRQGRGYPVPCADCDLQTFCLGVDPDVRRPEVQVRPQRVADLDAVRETILANPVKAMALDVLSRPRPSPR